MELAKVVGSVTLWELLMVIVPTWDAEAPMVFAKEILPPEPAVKTRLPLPPTVFWKMMLWFAADVFNVGVPERATGPEKEIGWPAVMAPERVTFPVVFWVNEPEIFAVPAKLSVPLLLTIMEALFSVCTLLLNAKLLPVSIMPMTPGMTTGPLNVVVPVPLVWTRASA